MGRLSPEVRSRLMHGVNTKSTKPEMTICSLLHGLGYRFRLHDRNLPETPDIISSARKAAEFVHGCFWHGHGCRIGQLRNSRLDLRSTKRS